MTIIGSRRISYIISGIFLVASFAGVLILGLPFGIDFTGGAILEVVFSDNQPSRESIEVVLSDYSIGNPTIQPTGDTGIIIRMADIDEATHQEVLVALESLGELNELRFNSIGPIIGEELRQKSFLAITLVVLLIVAYISWAFRGISYPMASWKYGVAAIVALLHDVMIPVGLFAFLGYFYGVEVNTLFVTALLTIFGFSVHDTIVVFDRIRENLVRLKASFEEIVEASVREIIPRSLSTSFAVLLVMGALYFFGGVTTQFFALAMVIGIFFGTYSSIFIASALLVSWHKFQENRTV
jgi:preprotein translocase subunit SecF